MQGEPFLRLLDTVIVKLVIHLSSPQRVQQISPHIFRKLARMNLNVCH